MNHDSFQFWVDILDTEVLSGRSDSIKAQIAREQINSMRIFK